MTIPLDTLVTVGGLLLIAALLGAIICLLRQMRRELRRDFQRMIWPLASAYLRLRDSAEEDDMPRRP